MSVAIDKAESKSTFKSPYACKAFTITTKDQPLGELKLTVGATTTLSEVKKVLDLKSGTFFKDKDGVSVCFDLVKGESNVSW